MKHALSDTGKRFSSICGEKEIQRKIKIIRGDRFQLKMLNRAVESMFSTVTVQFQSYINSRK